MAYSSTLLIEELTGAGGDVARTITLVGPGLPFMGSEWSTDSTIKTTWYPGNNEEGTQQILNTAVELPSTWNGEWRRTMLATSPCSWADKDGASRSTVAPQDLVDAFEAIFLDGQRLRVTWIVDTDFAGDTSLAPHKLVREGRCKNRKWKYTRLQDVEWELTFEWQSRGQGNTPQKVTSTRADTITANGAAYEAALATLVNAANLAQLQKFTPSVLTLGQLEQLATFPTQLVTSLSRQVLRLTHTIGSIVDIATTLASQPAHIQQAAVNTAQDAVSQAIAFKDQIDRVPLELESNRRTPIALLRAHQNFGAQADAATLLAVQALIYAQRLRHQVHQTGTQGGIVPLRLGHPNTVDQKYTTKAGDTPMRISQVFYKSPDFAVDILRANGLPWHTVQFDPGTVLVIPVLSSRAGSTGGA